MRMVLHTLQGGRCQENMLQTGWISIMQTVQLQLTHGGLSLLVTIWNHFPSSIHVTSQPDLPGTSSSI